MIWWIYFGTNVAWFLWSSWLIREWRKTIELNKDVLDLNSMLMEMMNIPQDSHLYDQDEDA